MATMTVREAILFSARLRLPVTTTLEEKHRRVEQVIDLLHLNNCADTIIGSALAKGGISGGEKKRVAIGMELITNPAILFLDEPTTGLDTYTAYSVISTVSSLAASGLSSVPPSHSISPSFSPPPIPPLGGVVAFTWVWLVSASGCPASRVWSGPRIGIRAGGVWSFGVCGRSVRVEVGYWRE